ncbi:hypothetical protein QNH99_09115 [Pantoea allii]|uniref:hypothetical protein n=1 Tax=Pantoea allii TaxID=574096 RepID=UPI003977C1CF
MIEAKVIKSHAGDFILLQVGEGWYIGVLFPNFNPNSHFDISKKITLNENDILEKENFEYLMNLAADIRKSWGKYSDREVKNIKVTK